MSIEAKELITAIKSAKTAVVIAHVNPDGDTLGSMLALAKLLEKAGLERVDRVMHDKVPETYKFFPDQEKVHSSMDEEDRAKLLDEYDLSFSCDCGSVERLGSAAEFWKRAKQTGNIDHHKSNPLFADLNMVDVLATSTGQVVYDLASQMGTEIDTDMARLMYVTLLTDTGGFKHTNTNENAFKWGAQLVAKGADPNELFHKLYDCMPFKTLRVIGDALNKIEVHQVDFKGKKINFAYTTTTRQFLNDFDADDEDTDEIVDHVMRIKDLDMCLYIREGHKAGVIKGSLRASVEEIDCARIAKQMNGGGHARAAGFNMDGDFDLVKAKVLDLVANYN